MIWASLGLALAATQTYALRTGAPFPTIADVADALMRPHVTRWPILAFWLWLGWHIYVRVTRPT